LVKFIIVICNALKSWSIREGSSEIRREISNISVHHKNDSQKLFEAVTYAAKRSGDKNLSSALNNISNRPELKRELLKKSAHEALAFFFK